MAKYGKWLAGGLGWVLGGPIGGIIGFLAGSMFDSAVEPNVIRQQHRTTRGDFGITLLILSAAVMKADGKILRSELDYVKRFFASQFGPAETQQLMLMLREILKQEYSLQEVCLQIKHNMEMPLRLQLLHYLFGISLSDKQASEAEIEIIHNIAIFIGISQKDFESIKAMFVKDTASAYKILEITGNTSDEEIKKAYRRMAVKYHPDKVAHLGEDMQKSAKEKFQQLNAAYEAIKNERGIS